jgi:chemotaxis protein methyltransferase CheR
MNDSDCIDFLQWVLPKLHCRWEGFRKVRSQACKRIYRRMQDLGLEGQDDYRQYLESHVDEWLELDGLTRITISRFYRDKAMFAFLEREVLPGLAQRARMRGDQRLKVLSLGCGSGEEPYTIVLLWMLRLGSLYQDLDCEVVAIDADPHMLKRAKESRYEYGTVKNLPEDLLQEGFISREGLFELRPKFKGRVRFLQKDVRLEMPAGTYDLVLCRNLVFTYYDADLQERLLDAISSLIKGDGALVIGIHEELPKTGHELKAWSERLRIYRKPG